MTFYMFVGVFSFSDSNWGVSYIFQLPWND